MGKHHIEESIAHAPSFEDARHLKKQFSIWSTSSLQYSLVCSGIAVGTFLLTVVGIGGSPVLVYGFIMAGSLDLVICFSLAELQSAFPHASGQVHWTYVLAPNRFKRAFSFVCGVLSCGAWIFASFSATFITSMFVFCMVELYHPTYVNLPFHNYLVCAACFLTGWAVNVFGRRTLALFTNAMAWIINISTLYIIVALLARSHPKQSAQYVFSQITDETGWDSKGVVFFLGLTPSIACLTLFDGAVHMTDEIVEPERNIPLVMLISNLASALIAFVCIIVYMFCVVNVGNLSEPIGGQPIVQLMLDSFGNKAMTTVGLLGLILTFWGSSTLYSTTTSRLIWSFANSNGLPWGSRFLGKISSTYKVPVNALTATVVVCLIVGTVMFGSASVLNAVLGTSMVCANLSYAMPIACLLYKTGFAMSPQKRFAGADVNLLNKTTMLPHFNLGRFGVVFNVVSILWVALMIVWLNFPLTYPVTTLNMNYACAVLGCTGIVGVILWLVYARKYYEHNMALSHAI